MLDKLDHYDLLGIVIPGVLLAYWVPTCFPQTVEMVTAAAFPEAIDIVGFAAVAIFLGQLIQAAASSLEPLLVATWGGRPSQRALDHGLNWLGKEYLSVGAARRIKARLAPLAPEDASNQDLFDVALTRANSAPGSRTERFNALYAYHRALVFVVTLALLLLVASRLWGRGRNVECRQVLGRPGRAGDHPGLHVAPGQATRLLLCPRRAARGGTDHRPTGGRDLAGELGGPKR